MITRRWIRAALLGSAALTFHAGTTLVADVPSAGEATRTFVINNLTVGDAAVSSSVVNQSASSSASSLA